MTTSSLLRVVLALLVLGMAKKFNQNDDDDDDDDDRLLRGINHNSIGS